MQLKLKAVIVPFSLCFLVSSYPWASSKSRSHAVIAERTAACVHEPDFDAFAEKHPRQQLTCSPQSVLGALKTRDGDRAGDEQLPWT